MSSSEPPPPTSAFAAFLAARRRKECEKTDIAAGAETHEEVVTKTIKATTASSGPSSSTLAADSSLTVSVSASTDNNQQTQSSSKIALLPQHVIDQIAAGEVVQRPVSVVKEMLENSLDAGATHIVVHVEKGGLSKLSISDNGCGIPLKDLPLLATRHATSKLTTVEDFSTLATFGFRGEAVASTSMVSRLLTITTRTSDSPVAYTQTYQNGQPTANSKPKPCARTVGTTVVVQDLFYNVPHRQKAYQKREHEEYAKILSVVQQYAIHYPTVGFVCQRTRGTGGSVVVDCNTSQIPAVKELLQLRETAAKATNLQDMKQQRDKITEATKQVVSHVLEANLSQHLMYFESCKGSGMENAKATAASIRLQYDAQVYFTPPDYNKNEKKSCNTSQGKFILFLNDRLIDLSPLKRAMEDVYTDFTTGTGNLRAAKPVLVVNLTVPGTQVDVNVHPSKRQVALMYQEDIIDGLCKELRAQLESCGHTFTTTQPPTKPVIQNPYIKKSTTTQAMTTELCSKTTTTNVSMPQDTTGKKRKAPPKDNEEAGDDHEEPSEEEDEDESNPKNSPSDGTSEDRAAAPTPTTTKDIKTQLSGVKKTKIAPSKMIRTHNAARAGAIEPFLVSTQPAGSQDSAQSTSDSSNDKNPEASALRFQRRHTSDCPLFNASGAANMDLSEPGAFANAMKCNCAPEVARQTVLVKQPTVRPKRVIPTECHYKSIKTLRRKLTKRQCMDTTKKLRQAFFMGTLSPQRSLVQCGEELVMINHVEMAKELFYQLALARFGGGAVMAHLGEVGSSGGIHIQKAIEQALQLEDELVLKHGDRMNSDIPLSENGEMLTVSVTNRRLAQQAASFLLEHANMLQDYFSIRIEQLERDDGEERDNIDNNVDAILTGLPVLLDGHSPQPHGLPIFLLRLANQVDYSEELPCFYGVCRELSNYYAMMPSKDSDLNPYVHHNLFPALSYLLLPSTNIQQNGYFTTMTKLSTLYKVFERC